MRMLSFGFSVPFTPFSEFTAECLGQGAGTFEHKFFNQYNGPKPELYRRYIDDCVGATSSTRRGTQSIL